VASAGLGTSRAEPASTTCGKDDGGLPSGMRTRAREGVRRVPVHAGTYQEADGEVAEGGGRQMASP
jgi:hypothetical protein